jgi:acetyl esterase/lipase
MSRTVLSVLVFIACIPCYSQKKPLDHSVYDGWQRIGERTISNDGKWIVYAIEPQEGDNELVIQSSDAIYKKTIDRGYNAIITEDSRYLIFRVKPYFRDTRDARIKKKKPDEMPKDSLGIIELGKEDVWKSPRVKNYKTPQKSFGWVAYHLEKAIDPPSRARSSDNANKRTIDSLNRIIDSLHHLILSRPEKKKKNKNKDNTDDPADTTEDTYEDIRGLISKIKDTRFAAFELDADGDEPGGAGADIGTDLKLRNLATGEEKTFSNVLEYYFSKTGDRLVLEQAKNPKDSLSRPMVVLYDLKNGSGKTLSKGGNDFKNFALSEDGSQVAYTAERDAKPKELQKFYKLWYYRDGMDSAGLLADRYAVGMQLGMTISEFGNLSFSKSGRRLFFGTAPVRPPKDTSLIDFELAKLDVWHYNDDYLQPMQIVRLQRDLQESFLAVYDLETRIIRQLGTKQIPVVYQTNEGDGKTFVGVTDFGKRIESQWAGTTKKDIYAIDVNTGTKKLVKKDMLGTINPQYIAPSGNYIMWYEGKARNYFVWDGEKVRNVTEKIKTPLYDEEHDSPNEPSPYGVMGWMENDSAVLLYDKFDIWRVDPLGKKEPVNILAKIDGRKNKIVTRYISLDPEKKYLKRGEGFLARRFSEASKDSRLSMVYPDKPFLGNPHLMAYSYGNPQKAKAANVLIFTRENYSKPADLFVVKEIVPCLDCDNLYSFEESKLSSINPQQKNYNWGTAELFKWKTFKGKASEGILYKPEDFDPGKKYPVIFYFYEELSDGLNAYIPPTPTASRLNISFFVSRGYLVFAPDIRYTIGHPAQSAYDYIVSAAQALAKNKWVDASNMGLQGQSWGGIQVAQVITMTNLFKAAWAGAPVANMTSAYGGIRWGTGVSRQFQYEKSQSRIGATLWEKPQLYIENSPLFHLPKVKTPLVIMANDADGAVPWYQGIELFTGLRRLGKPVWLLNYNGEQHNLVERRNRKDIQIREQQFFDWLLKGAHPAKWITEGVPATKKGKDWGLE